MANLRSRHPITVKFRSDFQAAFGNFRKQPNHFRMAKRGWLLLVEETVHLSIFSQKFVNRRSQRLIPGTSMAKEIFPLLA